jgi:hypothetical protein
VVAILPMNRAGTTGGVGESKALGSRTLDNGRSARPEESIATGSARIRAGFVAATSDGFLVTPDAEGPITDPRPSTSDPLQSEQ